MKHVFAPGCALMIYKPHLAEKLHEILNKNLGSMEILNICCKNKPELRAGTEVINICPGCDKRYRQNYESSTTLSLWEILAKSDFFPFPDYRGKKISIIDACPTRDQGRVHKAVRTLLEKMNISLVEPERTGVHGTCCGDTFWGQLPTTEVKKQMIKRASEMPVDDVAVYCVSCAKAMFVGGKKPRYMIDLLFEEETIPKTYEPDAWHKEIDEYMSRH